MLDMTNKVKVAVIASAHGVRGEVKLRALLETPTDLPAYSPLFTKDGREFAPIVTGHSKDMVIVRFPSIADRNAAEALQGQELFSHVHKLPEKSEGEFFYQELVGLKVLSETGETLGKVLAIHNFGAGDVVEVIFEDQTSEMFPFNDETFPTVDVSKGNLTLVKPEFI